MQLFASPTSPYARLIRTVIHEKALEDRIAVCMVDPWQDDADLTAHNPLTRVPTLETEDGTILTESTLIALYIDRLHPMPLLVPDDLLARVYRKLGLAQGVLDASVSVVMRRKFHDAEAVAADPLVQRRYAALRRTLPVIAGAGLGNPQRPDLGDLALAVALDYLDFRLPELAWQEGETELAAWHATLADRPCLRATEPNP